MIRDILAAIGALTVASSLGLVAYVVGVVLIETRAVRRARQESLRTARIEPDEIDVASAV